MKYYDYPAGKFSAARQALIPPHANGEHEALTRAFLECRLGLHRMNRSKLGDDTRSRIFALECFMDTSNFSDADGESALTLKLKSLTADDKAEIFRLVDELANWFDRQEP